KASKEASSAAMPVARIASRRRECARCTKGQPNRKRSLRTTLSAMRGAIAAGHRLTAEAGAEILAEGGNAVDACLAAAFASWVAESPLTGPAAGGFLLVHTARDRADRLLDFFVALPGRGSGRPPEPHMESSDTDFDA